MPTYADHLTLSQLRPRVKHEGSSVVGQFEIGRSVIYLFAVDPLLNFSNCPILIVPSDDEVVGISVLSLFEFDSAIPVIWPHAFALAMFGYAGLR